jgi:hypothetical protein
MGKEIIKFEGHLQVILATDSLIHEKGIQFLHEKELSIQGKREFLFIRRGSRFSRRLEAWLSIREALWLEWRIAVVTLMEEKSVSTSFSMNECQFALKEFL